MTLDQVLGCCEENAVPYRLRNGSRYQDQKAVIDQNLSPYNEQATTWSKTPILVVTNSMRGYQSFRYQFFAEIQFQATEERTR